MPKIIIETKTVTDKAKVKKYLSKNDIAYVKSDLMDGTTIFFIDSPMHDVSIVGATYTIKKLTDSDFPYGEVDPSDCSSENLPMKQPECDVIENINDEVVKDRVSNGKLVIYLAGIFALVAIYVVLF